MTQLLLHICCGPCSIMPVKALREEGYELLGWFMNPNIQPLTEYLRRRTAALECACHMDLALLCEDDWDLKAWLQRQLPFADSPERCIRCCAWRLEATARKALVLGIKHFSTSLLYSRFQPHDAIREHGAALARQYGLEFVYRDFRQYWQEGIDISKAWEVYRQPYCGCIFSEAERYAKKLKQASATGSKA